MAMAARCPQGIGVQVGTARTPSRPECSQSYQRRRGGTQPFPPLEQCCPAGTGDTRAR